MEFIDDKKASSLPPMNTRTLKKTRQSKLPPWEELPLELWAGISLFMDFKSFLEFSSVNKTFYALQKSEWLWKRRCCRLLEYQQFKEITRDADWERNPFGVRRLSENYTARIAPTQWYRYHKNLRNLCTQRLLDILWTSTTDVEEVKQLVELGANINKVYLGYTPLALCCLHNLADLAEYLISRGAIIDKYHGGLLVRSIIQDSESEELIRIVQPHVPDYSYLRLRPPKSTKKRRHILKNPFPKIRRRLSLFTVKF
jgi:hypothetical protein